MKQLTLYRAEDGSTFIDEQACIAYENACLAYDRSEKIKELFLDRCGSRNAAKCYTAGDVVEFINAKFNEIQTIMIKQTKN